jgi:4-hydroxythreonine-4-phosphate dehydrogenase
VSTDSRGTVAGRRPRLAFLLGDPNGIGPEIAVKLLTRPETRAAADVVVYTDPTMLAEGERVAGARVDMLRCAPGSLRFEPGRPTLVALDLIAAKAITPGEATQAAGRAALTALETAADAAQRGEVDGIVFAPLNKHALRLGGLAQEDELRYLQEKFGVTGFVSEFNVTGALWTSRVTSHIPLRAVADAITGEGVLSAVRIADRYLKAAGIAAPRIAVAGLNPHAGDSGSIGREEIDTIAPAIRRSRQEGIDARGPLSPDTLFLAARRGDFDAVVSMYHDQGQIAMKLMGFDNGVTLHGGLPVPVTTCASGSAFDIVGRNVARVDGLMAALNLAARIAARAVPEAGTGVAGG